MLVDFCLPVKNEEKILEANVMRLLKFLINQPLDYRWQITIMVNGSSDSSLAITKRIVASNSDHLVFYELKDGGKGRALKKCFNDSQADILVFMDIDLSSALENISSLLDPIIKGEADVSIGSRLISGATTNRSFLREHISKFYNLFSRCLLNHNFHDLQCGFKAIKNNVFQRIYPQLLDDAWFFDTELVVLSERFGYSIREVAIDWQENRFGSHQSAIKIVRDSWNFIVDSLVFRRRLSKIMKHRGNGLVSPER